jgi:hypothetical protein
VLAEDGAPYLRVIRRQGGERVYGAIAVSAKASINASKAACGNPWSWARAVAWSSTR